MRAVERPLSARLAEIGASASERFGMKVPDNSMDDCFPRGIVLDCARVTDAAKLPAGVKVVVMDAAGAVTVRELQREPCGQSGYVGRSRECPTAPLPADHVDVIGIVVGSLWPE